eukprot:scaffold88643_cov27-Tisochrysis_lutea.AAC.1
MLCLTSHSHTKSLNSHSSTKPIAVKKNESDAGLILSRPTHHFAPIQALQVDHRWTPSPMDYGGHADVSYQQTAHASTIATSNPSPRASQGRTRPSAIKRQVLRGDSSAHAPINRVGARHKNVLPPRSLLLRE